MTTATHLHAHLPRPAGQRTPARTVASAFAGGIAFAPRLMRCSETEPWLHGYRDVRGHSGAGDV